jgi:hypothetical protein
VLAFVYHLAPHIEMHARPVRVPRPNLSAPRSVRHRVPLAHAHAQPAVGHRPRFDRRLPRTGQADLALPRTAPTCVRIHRRERGVRRELRPFLFSAFSAFSAVNPP